MNIFCSVYEDHGFQQMHFYITNVNTYVTRSNAKTVFYGSSPGVGVQIT